MLGSCRLSEGLEEARLLNNAWGCQKLANAGRNELIRGAGASAPGGTSLATGSAARVWDGGTGSGAAPRHVGKHEAKQSEHGSSGFRAVPWRSGVGRAARTSRQAGKAAGRLSSRKSGVRAAAERKAGKLCFSKGAASHQVERKKPRAQDAQGQGLEGPAFAAEPEAAEGRCLMAAALVLARALFGHSSSQQVLGKTFPKLCTGQQGETKRGGGVCPAAAPRPPSRPFIFGAAARTALRSENPAKDMKGAR